MNTGHHFAKIIQEQFFKDKKSLFIDAAAINTVTPEQFSEVTGENSIIFSKNLLTQPHFLTLGKDESLEEAKYSNQKPKGKFDFILEDINTRLIDYYCSPDNQELRKEPVRHSPNIESFKMLSDKGVALVVNNEFAFVEIGLTDKLNKNGFYVNGVLGLPPSNEKLQGFSELSTRNESLFIISRAKSDSTFIADLSYGSIREKGYWLKVFDNYLMDRDSNSIQYGQFTSYVPCPIFRYTKSLIKFSKVSSYKLNSENYVLVKGLRDLVESIHYAPDIADELEDDHHGIFFKSHCELDSLSRPPATTSLDFIFNLEIAFDYLYIQFKEDVESEIIKYIELYLCTELGKYARFIHLFQAYFVEDDFSESLMIVEEVLLDHLPILLPTKGMTNLVNANEKIGLLQNSISEFQDGMNSNPDLFVNENINKIDDILKKMNLLNDADKIRALIRDIESSVVEFKESWRLPKKLREGQNFEKKSVEIEVTVFKVINSFLNTYGGELVIGIDDDTLDIVGIDEELKHFFSKSKSLTKKVDSFKKVFKERLDYAFEKKFIEIIDYKAITIDDKWVFFVTCPAAEEPCFFKEKFVEKYYEDINKGCSFYVREKDNTVCKKNKEQYEYITRRWALQA